MFHFITKIRFGVKGRRPISSGPGLKQQVSLREIYQSPACIYRAGRERSINRRHAWPQQMITMMMIMQDDVPKTSAMTAQWLQSDMGKDWLSLVS